MSLLVRIILLGFCVWLSPAWSLESSWLANTANNQQISVLFSAAKDHNNQIRVLLDVELMEGWKTYWYSPGEGGVTPEIKWSSDVDNVHWQWPTPQRFSVSGVPVQGYEDKVVFPITLSSNEQRLKGVLTLSTCSNVCILTDFPFDIDLSLPVSENFDYAFTKALATLPLKEGMVEQAQAFYADGQLVINAERAQGWQDPELFFNIPDGVNFSEPQIQYQETFLQAVINVSDTWGQDIPQLQGQDLSIVISDRNIAQEMVVPIEFAHVPINSHETSLWLLAGFALLGGLVLNLMPCVLPVLGMKLSSVLHVKQREQKSIRKQFLLSASGIMASFLFLAALMIILRITQQAVGWGIQFQNVWFIGLMVIVTAIFSANLLGLLSINLSSRFSTRLATTGGHFWEGAFATLLATPCSAPFLGTAVAYALVAPYSHLWLIFILLAVGMSLPWLLIAAFPKIALCLPKPGRWMNILRLAMGIMMLASSFWLLSLLIVHIGWLAFMITLIAISFLLLGLIGRRYGKKAFLYSFISLVLVIIALISMDKLMQNNTIIEDKLLWQPVSEQAIEDALQDNKIVFIDITADWCITCKVNKLNVLMDDDVQKAFLQNDIVTLRGDWTVPSDEITAFLKQRGALAVPFNQIYSPSKSEGIILPTLLDKQALLDLLKQEVQNVGVNRDE